MAAVFIVPAAIGLLGAGVAARIYRGPTSKRGSSYDPATTDEIYKPSMWRANVDGNFHDMGSRDLSNHEFGASAYRFYDAYGTLLPVYGRAAGSYVHPQLTTIGGHVVTDPNIYNDMRDGHLLGQGRSVPRPKNIRYV
jgi:hypothetical protein